MSAYMKPNWCCAPSSKWNLDEIKNGIIVQNHDLSTSLIAFGRAADVKESTNICTAHESCSRLHARIAFDSHGIPWLRDLGSGNGTRVNKIALPKRSIGRVENLKGEGSRGVMIYPGDMIQFGASTRIYVLNGPPEFERGALKARRERSKLASREKISAPIAVDKNDIDTKNVSWGISFDESHVDEDRPISDHSNQNAAPSNIMSEIPSKHRGLYDSIQAKKYKIQNIQLEKERIQRKAFSVELTDGQSKQIERLEKREADLCANVEALETKLIKKLRGDDSRPELTSKKNRRDEREEYDDVDDFYDRTNTKRTKLYVDDSRTSALNLVETDHSLIAKCKILLEKLKQGRTNVEKAESKVEKIQEQLKTMTEEDEESFFLRNNLDLAKDELVLATNIVRSIADDITENEEILKFSNEKIIVDRQLGFVGYASELNTMPSSRSIQTEKEPTTTSTVFQMPMPPPKKKDVEDMPPRCRPRKTSYSNPPVNEAEDSKVVQLSQRTVGPMPPPPPQGTLSVLSQHLADKKRSSGVINRVTDANSETMTFGNSRNEIATLSQNKANNPKIDKWVVPTNQDGSGMTKLNEKFRGRY